MSAAREASNSTPMSDLDVRVFTVGPIQENAYIVSPAGSGRVGYDCLPPPS